MMIKQDNYWLQNKTIIEVIKELWAKRTFVYKSIALGAVIGLIIAFSIPESFNSTAKLAPEMLNSNNSLGGLGGLAAIAGISANNLNSTGDAISALHYPDVVGSTPFIMGLFSLKISTIDGEINTDLFTYLRDHQKTSWWRYIYRMPKKIFLHIKNMFADKESSSSEFNIETPTKIQYNIYQTLRSLIYVTVDDKSNIISVSVNMQDPQVAYVVAKEVVKRLQNYITDYRTQKIKTDLSYVEKVLEQSKCSYFEAQKAYAIFEDENKSISTSAYRTELERLRNDMNLRYNVYSNLSNNVEEKKIKVQDYTPVYTIIQPASRPIDNSAPNKSLILVTFTFLAGFISVVYRIFKDNLLFSFDINKD